MSGLVKKASSVSRAVSESEQLCVRAFCRCNSGHYFQGEFCPFDGWSSKASKELADAVRRLAALGEDLSLRTLRGAGVSTDTLEHVLVVQFGARESAFEALAPKEYVVDGKPQPAVKVSRALK